MEFRLFLEGNEVSSLVTKLRTKYPFLTLHAYSTKDRIEIMDIDLPAEEQGKGIGSEIIQEFQKLAQLMNLPIVLRPQAKQRKKKALERFYKRHGFVKNTGRNKDFTLSSPFAATMYWKP